MWGCYVTGSPNSHLVAPIIKHYQTAKNSFACQRPSYTRLPGCSVPLLLLCRITDIIVLQAFHLRSSMRAVRAFAGMAASRSLSSAFSPATTAIPSRRREESKSATAWYPSAEQGSAINTLLSFNNSEILAWLTVLRSIEPTFQCRSGNGGGGHRLSQQQLEALLCLSSTTDEEIEDWLALSRRRSSSFP